MQKRVICGGIAAILLMALGLFAIFGLQSVVDNAILENVVLAP